VCVDVLQYVHEDNDNYILVLQIETQEENHSPRRAAFATTAFTKASLIPFRSPRPARPQPPWV
jgi:hypothetical protein